ncbi:MAG: hypothetical protein AB8I08_14410 [Sandaracinaceae bacterium]
MTTTKTLLLLCFSLLLGCGDPADLACAHAPGGRADPEGPVPPLLEHWRHARRTARARTPEATQLGVTLIDGIRATAEVLLVDGATRATHLRRVVPFDASSYAWRVAPEEQTTESTLERFAIARRLQRRLPAGSLVLDLREWPDGTFNSRYAIKVEGAWEVRDVRGRPPSGASRPRIQLLQPSGAWT